jgi:hypothetical protein
MQKLSSYLKWPAAMHCAMVRRAQVMQRSTLGLASMPIERGHIAILDRLKRGDGQHLADPALIGLQLLLAHRHLQFGQDRAPGRGAFGEHGRRRS